MLDYLLLVTGLTVLLIGGDNLIRGAVGFAENLRVPPFIIGLTLVAIGTSAPELVVSLRAAVDGSGGIAIGNVIGSNIANVFLVLAIPSLIRRTPCDEKGIGKNLIVMIGVTIVFMGMLAKGRLEHYDGLILLALLGLFIHDQFRTAHNHRKAAAEVEDYHDEIGRTPHRPLIIGIMVAGGIIALPVGAELTVRAASTIAAGWGISEEVIGLTIVAIGTSLPELAAGLLAVLRNSHSVALGNVVGSNIFNIVSIMGITASIFPLPVAGRIVSVDSWVMLGAAGLIAVFAHFRIAIGKRIGIAMLAGYGGYVGLSYIF